MAQQFKLDKETLIKHRFWFLLPVIALAILIGWIAVLYVRSDAQDFQTKADSTYKQLKGLLTDAQLRNTTWVERMAAQKRVAEAQKARVWVQNYDAQNGVEREPFPELDPNAPPGAAAAALPKVLAVRSRLITWPEETVTEWNKNNRNRPSLAELDFGENLGIVPYDYKDHYKIQFDKLVDVLPWLNEAKDPPEGAIRVRGGKDDHRVAARALLLRPHELKASDREVESREAWTLQEELAIRKELLKGLALVMENYSRMNPEWRRIAPPEPEPAKPAAPASAGQAPAATQPAATAPAAPAADEGEVIERASFYNSVWPTTLLPTPPAVDEAGRPRPIIAPSVEDWQGWQIDLRMVVDERKKQLRGTASNFSAKLKIPAARLAVYFRDTQGNELPTPIILDDAGDLGTGQPEPGGLLTKPATKTLRTIDLPPAAFRISRLARATESGVTDSAVLYNQNWLLELALVSQPGNATSQIIATLHNRGVRRLTVPYFRMDWSEDPQRRADGRDDKPRQERLRFPMDVLDSGAKRQHTFEIKLPQPPKRIVGVHEVMDWRTTPIKRIDLLEIGKEAHFNSDRTKVVSLVSFNFSNKDFATASPTPLDQKGGPDESANHKVFLKRYIETSKEVRRLPVALVLVVDASTVNDVVTSMSNSRLSFQVTQVAMNSIPSLGPPASVVSALANPEGGGSPGAGQPAQPGQTGSNPGAGMNRPGGGLGGLGSPPPGGPAAPPAAPPADAGKAASAVVDDSNVVLLQIFGMVTLYESPDAEARIAAERSKAAAAASNTPAR